jgi:hypothetical protein
MMVFNADMPGHDVVDGLRETLAEIADDPHFVGLHLCVQASDRCLVGGSDGLGPLHMLDAVFDGDRAKFVNAGTEPFQNESTFIPTRLGNRRNRGCSSNYRNRYAVRLAS